MADADDETPWTISIDETFDVEVDKLYRLIFGDNSGFFTDFVTRRGVTDLVIGEWQDTVEADSDKQRVLTFTVHPNQFMAPSDIPSTETQTSVQTSTDEYEKQYIVRSRTTTTDHAYADSFYVLVQYELSRLSDRQCRMIARNKLVFLEYVMARGMIVNNTTSEFRKYGTDLVAACTNHFRNENVQMPMHVPRLRIRETKFQKLLRSTLFKFTVRCVFVCIVAFLVRRIIYNIQ